MVSQTGTKSNNSGHSNDSTGVSGGVSTVSSGKSTSGVAPKIATTGKTPVDLVGNKTPAGDGDSVTNFGLPKKTESVLGDKTVEPRGLFGDGDSKAAKKSPLFADDYFPHPNKLSDNTGLSDMFGGHGRGFGFGSKDNLKSPKTESKKDFVQDLILVVKDLLKKLDETLSFLGLRLESYREAQKAIGFLEVDNDEPLIADKVVSELKDSLEVNFASLLSRIEKEIFIKLESLLNDGYVQKAKQEQIEELKTGLNDVVLKINLFNEVLDELARIDVVRDELNSVVVKRNSLLDKAGSMLRRLELAVIEKNKKDISSFNSEAVRIVEEEGNFLVLQVGVLSDDDTVLNMIQRAIDFGMKNKNMIPLDRNILKRKALEVFGAWRERLGDKWKIEKQKLGQNGSSLSFKFNGLTGDISLIGVTTVFEDGNSGKFVGDGGEGFTGNSSSFGEGEMNYSRNDLLRAA